MVNDIAQIGSDNVCKCNITNSRQSRACIDHHAAACVHICNKGTGNIQQRACPNTGTAAKFSHQRQQHQDTGAHGGHCDHLELCLNLTELTVGIAPDNPARIIDQRDIAHIGQNFRYQQNDHKDDPVLALQAGLQLLHHGSFLLDSQLLTYVLNTNLVAAFLSNTLTGVEILNKCQRYTDHGNNGHSNEIALSIIAIDRCADGG